MNIFVLDEDPVVSARYHCDQHVIKMIIEYAQLLSNAHRVLDGVQKQGFSPSGRNQKQWIHPDRTLNDKLYKTSHVNVGVALWVRESKDNYDWLFNLFVELDKEFVRRYNKKESHKSVRDLADILHYTPDNIPNIGMTDPYLAMPDCFKNHNAVQAYRNFYIGDKVRFATWKNTEKPYWYITD
jgi:hypothetical protein